jgi:hypothetical protein
MVASLDKMQPLVLKVIDVHWQKPMLPVTSKDVNASQLTNFKVKCPSLPVAPYVLAKTLSTLFSLGHNPERTECIYTISHDFFKDTCQYYLLPTPRPFKLPFRFKLYEQRKFWIFSVSHVCYNSRQDGCPYNGLCSFSLRNFFHPFFPPIC